jgi:hypothetical protein
VLRCCQRNAHTVVLQALVASDTWTDAMQRPHNTATAVVSINGLRMLHSIVRTDSLHHVEIRNDLVAPDA